MEVKTKNCVEGNLPHELSDLLLSLASNWGDGIEVSAMKVECLKGAMNNEVCRISWPIENGESSRNVLVKIYGTFLEVFFNREEEIKILDFMSRVGFGPRLLGKFSIGRVEEFIHARDYEYASYNPVAYDIANHFCEMVANYHSETPHILDYKKYPSLEERHRFIRAYLGYAGHEPDEREIEKLLEEVEKYTLANHIFWGLWMLISAYVSTIDFDYLDCGRQMFQQYWLKKPQLLGV